MKIYKKIQNWKYSPQTVDFQNTSLTLQVPTNINFCDKAMNNSADLFDNALSLDL